jgi:hypothetical protein
MDIPKHPEQLSDLSYGTWLMGNGSWDISMDRNCRKSRIDELKYCPKRKPQSVLFNENAKNIS